MSEDELENLISEARTLAESRGLATLVYFLEMAALELAQVSEDAVTSKREPILSSRRRPRPPSRRRPV